MIFLFLAYLVIFLGLFLYMAKLNADITSLKEEVQALQGASRQGEGR